MDKQTLSGYGWIVIVTLVLAVLLALATPFGTYVGDGVVTTVNGLINTSSKAVDEDQINTMSDKWENKFSTFDKAGSVNNGKEETLAPGLYDENGNMTMSWEELLTKEITATNSMGDTYTNVILKMTQDGILSSNKMEEKVGNVIIDYQNIKGKLVIPESVKQIEESTFYYACYLTSLVIPNGIERLDDNSFAYCSNMKTVELPNSINTIKGGAFMYCSSLQTINYNGTMNEWNNIQMDYYWNSHSSEFTVHCTDGDIVIPVNNEK